jgi:hypothetical protein
VDRDDLIGVTELASYVDRRVPELSYEAFKIRQVPGRKYGWAADSFSPPVRGLGIVEIVPNYAGAELSCHLSN